VKKFHRKIQPKKHMEILKISISDWLKGEELGRDIPRLALSL
jgi:hypothetical protein